MRTTTDGIPKIGTQGGGVDRVSLVIRLGFRPLRILEYVVRTADHDFERDFLKMPENFILAMFLKFKVHPTLG